MGMLVTWAMLTGGVIGGVWVSIVLLGNQAALRREQQVLGDGVDKRREEVARLEARLEFMESQFRQVDSGIPSRPANDATPSDTGAAERT